MSISGSPSHRFESSSSRPITGAFVGARAEVRDAFIYYRYKAGTLPGEVRAGWQVINWGESTFIQGGINAINTLDVSVLRVPGSELRDALLPAGAVKLSFKPTDSTSIEGFSTSSPGTS